MPLSKRPNLTSFPSKEGDSDAEKQFTDDYEMDEEVDEDNMVDNIWWEEISEGNSKEVSESTTKENREEKQT